MAEKMSLRDRRRLETALDIRMATLRLSLSVGFDAVTTEMISAEAGISPRTFFNYFPNKEAALIGPADEMTCETMALFHSGTGRITDDFITVLRAHFTEQPPKREFFQGLLKVRSSSPHLELAFARSMEKMLGQISGALQQRFGPGSSALADLLAATLTQSVSTAMMRWAQDDRATVEDLLTEVRRLLAALAEQLKPGST